MRREKLKCFLFTTVLGRVGVIPLRCWHSFRVGFCHCGIYLRWLFLEREVSTFSYRLTARSKQSLCNFADHVSAQLFGHAARRLAAFESGARQRAIQEHRREGGHGRLITTDIDRAQGYAIAPPWTEVTEFIPEDFLAMLVCQAEEINLYVHDTSTKGSFEEREFAALELRRSLGWILLSPWSTSVTRKTAARWGCTHWEWKDEPENRWYSGGLALICTAQNR